MDRRPQTPHHATGITDHEEVAEVEGEAKAEDEVVAMASVAIVELVEAAAGATLRQPPHIRATRRPIRNHLPLLMESRHHPRRTYRASRLGLL
jgi:hypothetical protein